MFTGGKASDLATTSFVERHTVNKKSPALSNRALLLQL